MYRIPGLSCKLTDLWEGPYEVLERVGQVNYRICKVGSKKQCKVVHVNCIKKIIESVKIARFVEEEEVERNVLK